jgi:hypothetical protein
MCVLSFWVIVGSVVLFGALLYACFVLPAKAIAWGLGRLAER